MNRSLETMLREKVAANQLDWDDHVAISCAAYRQYLTKQPIVPQIRWCWVENCPCKATCNNQYPRRNQLIVTM